MPTKVKFFFPLILVVLLLTVSCSTTVTYSVAMPSEVSLGNYKNIAVASTEEFQVSKGFWNIGSSNKTLPVKNLTNTGLNISIPTFSSIYQDTEEATAAKNASNVIVKAVDQGYYNIVDQATTDAIILLGTKKRSVLNEMLNNNIDVVIKSSISSQTHDEYIEIRGRNVKDSDSASHVAYDFYYIQKASITLDYQVIDVKANDYITTSSISKDFSDSTLIGCIDPAKNKGAYQNTIYSPSKFSDIYRSLLNSCYEEIRNTLVPHVETFRVSLAKNDMKDTNLDVAYKLAENGYYNDAYNQFFNYWTVNGYAPAGYNAAVMLGAMGKFGDGADLAYKVFILTAMPDALKLSQSLRNYQNLQDAVQKQMTSPASSGKTKNELIGF